MHYIQNKYIQNEYIIWAGPYVIVQILLYIYILQCIWKEAIQI